jgi:phenylalanyl-tRNA synthetase beta chain
VTHALVAPDAASRLAWPDAENLQVPQPEAGATISVTNPLSGQHSVLRRHVVGSLLDVLALNERQGRSDVAIFEIGKGYGSLDGKPVEWTRLALLISGVAEPAAWNRVTRMYDLDDAKGLVELLSTRLGVEFPGYGQDGRGYPFHPGRALSFVTRTGDTTIGGRVAELHPDVLEKWELRSQRVIVAELAISALDGGRPLRIHVEPIPRFPEVERDLAVIVSEELTAERVEGTIRDHAGPLLRALRLFDVYRGAPLAATEKSMAYRLVFGLDRTLNEAEVDEAVAGVRGGLERALGAHLRV